MTDTNQKLREALQVAAKHLDMGAFELSYPKEADLIRDALSLPTQAGAVDVPTDGWLQDGGLLYRLTDDRNPKNRDEIYVTMADGSRSDASRTRRAGELLDRIRSIKAEPVEGGEVDQARFDAGCDVLKYLRQSLQAIANIDDATNHSVDASAALDRIGQIARQALAMLAATPAPAPAQGVVMPTDKQIIQAMTAEFPTPSLVPMLKGSVICGDFHKALVSAVNVGIAEFCRINGIGQPAQEVGK